MAAELPKCLADVGVATLDNAEVDCMCSSYEHTVSGCTGSENDSAVSTLYCLRKSRDWHDCVIA